MKKYFILSCVALLATNTANAATKAAAEFSAKGRFILPTEVSCTSLVFGKLYVKKTENTGTMTATMNSNGTVTMETAGAYELMYDGTTATPATCTNISANNDTIVDGIIKLSGDSIYVDNIKFTDGKLTGSLNITPDAVITGEELSASAVVGFIY